MWRLYESGYRGEEEEEATQEMKMKENGGDGRRKSPEMAEGYENEV
jgi:hypothetical protein